jgi:hypothetical protein
MERSLLFGASALGIVGWVLSIALARSERTARAWQSLARPFRWTAVALPVLVFLVTLPSRAPFSAGQGFGRGFLIGGVAALLAALAVAGVRRSERAGVNAAIVAAPLWLAIPATALPLLFMRDVVMDALMGVAIGFISVTSVVYQGLAQSSTSDDRADTRLTLLSGAGYSVALAVAAGMGVYRGHEIVESSRWGAAAVLAGTAIPLAVWVASLPSAFLLGPLRRLPGVTAVASKGADVLKTEARREAAATGLRLLVGAIVLLVAGRLLATRLLNDLHGFYVAAIGLAVGFLAWWLASDGAQASLGDLGQHRRPLAVLIALGAAMACFNLLLGFGMAMMCLALWLPFSLALCGMRDVRQDAEPDRRLTAVSLAQTLWSVAAFTAVLTVYRFLATRFQTDLRGVILTDHYAIFGFIAGAAIPGVISGIASSGASARPVIRVLRLVAAGLLALAVPGLILVLWKAKATLAILSGAALAAAGFDWLTSQRSDDDAMASRLFLPLMAIAVCLAMAQWTPQALEVASLTRDQKIRILAWLLGGIAAVLVTVDLGERWLQWRKRSGRRSAAGGSTQEAAR